MQMRRISSRGVDGQYFVMLLANVELAHEDFSARDLDCWGDPDCSTLVGRERRRISVDLVCAISVHTLSQSPR